MRKTVFFLSAQDEQYGGLRGVSPGETQTELTLGGCVPLSELYQGDPEIEANSQVLVGKWVLICGAWIARSGQTGR